jgi:hypothetical protein
MIVGTRLKIGIREENIQVDLGKQLSGTRLPLAMSPTYLHRWVVVKFDDYGKKWSRGGHNDVWSCPRRTLFNLHESFGRQGIGKDRIAKIFFRLSLNFWGPLASTRSRSLYSFKSASPFN